jgi:ribosomal protein S27AE
VARRFTDYFDAIYNKKSKVVLVLVEAFGGIVEETMVKLGRLARRSKGPGAVDRTEYGRHRCSPSTFVVLHRQRLSNQGCGYV